MFSTWMTLMNDRKQHHLVVLACMHMQVIFTVALHLYVCTSEFSHILPKSPPPRTDSSEDNESKAEDSGVVPSCSVFLAMSSSLARYLSLFLFR